VGETLGKLNKAGSRQTDVVTGNLTLAQQREGEGLLKKPKDLSRKTEPGGGEGRGKLHILQNFLEGGAMDIKSNQREGKKRRKKGAPLWGRRRFRDKKSCVPHEMLEVLERRSKGGGRKRGG